MYSDFLLETNFTFLALKLLDQNFAGLDGHLK